MTSETPFFQNYIQGGASNDDITNAIAEWHEDPQGTELHEYLGLTWDEYRLWVERPQSLPFIAQSHRNKQSLVDVLRDSAGEDPDALDVLQWLHSTGRADST